MKPQSILPAEKTVKNENFTGISIITGENPNRSREIKTIPLIKNGIRKQVSY